MFKTNIARLQNNYSRLAFDKRWELYLYIPLIKLKGFKVLKRTDKINGVINISKLNTKYNYFNLAKKIQDNLNNNTFALKNYSLIENNFLNIIEDKNTVMKLYTNKGNRKYKYYKYINYIGKNIIEESYNDIKSRKMSNRLLLPYYFFTARYNEKNMPSQNRSWSNSVYNFLKIEKSGIKYLDIYSSKLIKLFLNIKYIQRKKIWDAILLNGLKIKPNLSIIKDINTMIKYTSTRSSWSFKNLSYYPSIILTFTWLLEQIKFSSYIRKIIIGRKEGIISGLKIKKKNYIRKLDRIFVSKPLFKHTSFNLIIDLFIYNNKTNKLQKFENILSRRVLYKYIYSMYVDYSKKIKETLNRPRFFYLNMIEPKTYNYYSNIIKLYENIITMNNKGNFLYLCLLIIKWNFIRKNNIQYLKDKYLFFKYNKFNNIKFIINYKFKNLLSDKDILYENENNTVKIENNDTFVKEIEKDMNTINEKDVNKIGFKKLIFYKNKNLFKYKYYHNLDTKYINMKKKILSIDMYNSNKDIFKYEKEEYNKEEKRNKKKKNKNVFGKNRISNKDIYNYKKHDNYKFFINSSYQDNIKKKQINLYNKNKNNLMQTIWSKNSSLSKKDNSCHLLLNEPLNNKEKYIENINYLKNNNNVLNRLFGNFFLSSIKKDIYINLIKDKKSIISKLNENINFKKYKFNLYKREKKYISKNNSNILYIKNINKNKINSKKLWDNLDYSIIYSLSNIFLFNKNNKLELKLFSYKTLFNKIKNIINNNNIWYMHLIKKEFYIVNRDVLLSKLIDILPNGNDMLSNSYKYDNDSYKINILEYKKGTVNLDINLWSNNIINERDANLINKIRYNEEIFKPYYKYMIPLFIYKSYKSFIYYLGSKDLFIKIKTPIYSKYNWIYTINYTILNFIIVKTLLDLMHYNYRSLIKIKPKYYYLNKLRYYSTKVKRLNFNTWIASVKYIKRLRKTPRQFWLRYHKLASFYYDRIIQNAELNTKRKVLLPFVFYFEDLLFNIYGKWAIMRLWPIKRHYLNSYILAERIMSVILAQDSSTSSILEYRQSARNLINILRWSQVKKAYYYYNENNSRWPINLIDIMKESSSSHYLNYSTLEFFNSKLEKAYNLNTYPLDKARLNCYLPSVKFNYIYAFNNNINNIKNWYIKNKLINKKGKMSNIYYVYYWLRPLNSYLMYIKNNLDISGIKFKLTGRPGIIKSNVRSFTKTYFYGNLLGPRHFNSKTLKTTSLSNPLLRGTIKSNIDYAYYTSKSNNGSITLKIWMSSLFSSDIHELLLYLLRIKNLYFELVSRYYLVYSKFSNLKYYYSIKKTNKLIWIRKKIKKRKKLKKFLYKIKQRRNISFLNLYKLNKKMK